MTARSILIVYLALLALEFVVEQLLTLVNIRHLAGLRGAMPPQVLGLMGPETYRKSSDYTVQRSRLSLMSTTVHRAALVLLVFSGGLGDLERVISSLSGMLGPILSSVVFVFACSVAFGLIGLPFSLYSQFVIEARFGFNRTSWRLWAIDALKGLAVSLVLATPLLYGLFALVRSTPLWWLWAFAGFAGLQVVMVYLYPKVIAPLFNRYTPLEEGPLRQRLHALAERLGVRTQGIFVVDGSRRSSHSNAYFSGFGRAKRIVLFDTLVRGLSEQQVAAVLAHEIGHQKLRHVVVRIIAALGLALLGFWVLGVLVVYPPLFAAFGFDGPGAAAGLALALYFAGPLGLLGRPFASWWSRRQEYGADRFARDSAGEGAALREALAQLSRDNLSNPTPHPWYSFVHYSHPTVLERILALERPVTQA